MNTPLIFGREPAAIAAAITAIVALLSAFVLHLAPESQGLITAFSSAVLTVVVAIKIHDGNLITVIVGAAKAGLSLALGFGLQWDAVQQATAITAVEVILSLLLRSQVVAPVAANNVTRTKSDVNQVLNSMKRTASIIVAATILFATSLSQTSCAFNPNAGATENAATFWNSPQFQQALTTLGTRAFEILTNLVGKMGASPKSKSVQDAAFDQLKSENPTVPDEVLRGVIAKQARKL